MHSHDTLVKFVSQQIINAVVVLPYVHALEIVLLNISDT